MRTLKEYIENELINFMGYYERTLFDFIKKELEKNPLQSFNMLLYTMPKLFTAENPVSDCLNTITKSTCKQFPDLTSFQVYNMATDIMIEYFLPHIKDIYHKYDKKRNHIFRTIIPPLYKELKSHIRKNITNIFPDIHSNYKTLSNDYYYDSVKQYINNCTNLAVFDNFDLSLDEKKYLLDKVSRIYKQELNDFVVTYGEKHNITSNIYNKIFPQLAKYLNQNLRKIFLQFDLEKDENDNQIIRASWTDANGNIYYSGGEYEYIYNWLVDNKQQLLTEFNISSVSDKKWKNIISVFLDKYQPNIMKKIYNLIHYKNDAIKKKRSNDLLQLKDDIKDKTHIDYDPTADHVRTRPIIIVQDTDGKNYVVFGDKGTSHVNCVNINVENFKKRNNLTLNPYVMGYGYLVGKIAFVDKDPDGFQAGLTNDEVVQILINDPRIEKVYQTASHPMPGGGLVTRLAKLIAKR